MKIHGNEVMWRSDHGNIIVTYNQFALDGQYNVYHKHIYGKNIDWRYTYTCGTISEAVNYGKKIYDEAIIHEEDEVWAW